jgi:transposase
MANATRPCWPIWPRFWAGTCPGSNESAGRVKSTATRPGNPYLKVALGAAALSIANSHGTYLAAKYRRIAAHRGPKKALVAIEHTILIAIWLFGFRGGERSASDWLVSLAVK